MTPHCWLSSTGVPITACIKLKSLVLTCRILAASAPSYLNNLVWTHATLLLLCSAHYHRLEVMHSATALKTILIPCGGTTSWALLEQGQPSLEALEHTDLLRAPALLTALMFLLLLLLTSAFSFCTVVFYTSGLIVSLTGSCFGQTFMLND